MSTPASVRPWMSMRLPSSLPPNTSNEFVRPRHVTSMTFSPPRQRSW